MRQASSLRGTRSARQTSKTKERTMKETVKVTVESTGNKLQVKAGTRGFEITLDEPESSGGGNSGMNPVEALLCALGACQSIATLIFAGMDQVPVQGVKVELEGDIDTDGFLGINPQVRNGFQEIRKDVVVKCADKDAALAVAKHAEKQCPVADCVANPVPIVSSDIVVE